MGLKNKRRAQDEIECFKARYVAKGLLQVYGANSLERWAPVGRYATLRMLLSLCAVEDLGTRHIDIKCAFLFEWCAGGESVHDIASDVQ